MKHLLYCFFFSLIYSSGRTQHMNIPNYTLPDVLASNNGTAIKTSADWENKRRQEILELFAQHVQGKTPQKKIESRIVLRDKNTNALNGRATRKQVRIYFGGDDKHHFDLLIYLPNQSKKKVPVFLGLNFSGNQTVHSDPGIFISDRWVRYGKEPEYVNNVATNASRGIETDQWSVEKILSAGYGLVTMYYGDLQPDSSNSAGAGIAPLFYKPGQMTPESNEWGAIGVWAWALSRAMDFLEKEKAVDAKKVAVIGHSRLGKTALWAGAQDKRFAMVISNNSGEGGAAITRRKYGETSAVMNKSFPHWFSANYKKFDDKEDELPVDYHELIALIAPRPVYIASASEDQWADPTGEYLGGYHAGKVYALYSLKGLETENPPPANQPVGDGHIGYHMRQGIHDITPYDWDQYIRFADRFFK
ncbi:hypothetical protein [Pollutibacter soli]|uniref:glucuronyl esterase domain-containing protein n=1 Tax=Pollutibacter soli TaxID=3034157 RepID=UPI0030136E63